MPVSPRRSHSREPEAPLLWEDDPTLRDQPALTRLTPAVPQRRRVPQVFGRRGAPYLALSLITLASAAATAIVAGSLLTWLL